MSMKDKTIRIDDWTGNILFIGDYDDPKVDKVLDANRCPCRFEPEIVHEMEVCEKCDDTGYLGDFEVSWIDNNPDEKGNVYEYISY